MIPAPPTIADLQSVQLLAGGRLFFIPGIKQILDPFDRSPSVSGDRVQVNLARDLC